MVSQYGTRRKGQRGTPRAAGRPRVLPGTAELDPAQNPEFLSWQAKYNPGGTYPEFLVFRWLEKRGLRYPIEFQYQVPFGGGRQVFGAVVTDFVIQDYIALSVLGVYYHFTRDPSQRERDEMARARLQALRLTYVEALDIDLLTRLEQTMELAMLGQEQPGARYGHQ